MDSYLIILNLAWNVCTAKFAATNLRANPPALIENCASKKTWCMSRAKNQRAVRACLQD